MTQSTHQALDDDRRLPWPEAMGKATIRARFMLAYADADADALPDAHAPRGTVTLTYAGSGYRWTDADGSRLVAALPVVCPILPDGTLGSPDYDLAGDGRVIIMPTEVAGLEPAGSTVTATIRIANAQAKFEPVTFTVKPDDDINLAELVSVQATPGVVTIVDDTIAVRAEAAANRAEDAASDVGGALTQITSLQESAADLAGVPRLTNLLHDIAWRVGESATIDSQADGLVKFTATARAGHIRAGLSLQQGGSVYYYTAEVKTTSDQVFFGPNVGAVYSSGSGDWERLTGTATPTSGTILRVNDKRASGWDQIEVRDPVLIDLTAVFGAGREPTKEYMDALLAKHGNYIGGVDQFAFGDALQAVTVVGPGMALRVDNSVGTRVLLDYPGGATMLYGDTGWRDVSYLFSNAESSTPLRLRRTNNMVTLDVQRVQPTADFTTGSSFIGALPSGFRPNVRRDFGLQAGVSSTTFRSAFQFATGAIGCWNPSTDDTYYLSITYPTSDPWPTTQPGTPL